MYAVHGGHLSQPLTVTDASQTIVWQAEFTPFGAALPIIDTDDPGLRFPGQWAEGETGLLQNWHRDYDPPLGRYIEADPLCLDAGQSLYGYVRQDPLGWIDPEGLKLSKEAKKIKREFKEAIDKLFKGLELTKTSFIKDGVDERAFGKKNDKDVQDFIAKCVTPSEDVIAGRAVRLAKGVGKKIRGFRAPQSTKPLPQSGRSNTDYNHPSQRSAPNFRGRIDE